MGMYSSNGGTYLVVDGENISAILGLSVLERRPSLEERPRWDRALGGARRIFDEEVKGLFFSNSSSGALPTGFVQILTAMDYTVIPPSGPEDVKVVDVGLQRTIEAIGELEPGDAILASHDADFAPQVGHSLDLGRNVTVMCFHEFLVSGLYELEERGLKVIDFEYDVHAFQVALPRLRIIDVGDFDPFDFL